MEGFKAKEYKIFELFDKQWAIVTAGSMAHYNSCTVSWGSLGNIWGHAGHSCPIVTVYVHPARYTSEFLRDSDIHGELLPGELPKGAELYRLPLRPGRR